MIRSRAVLAVAATSATLAAIAFGSAPVGAVSRVDQSGAAPTTTTLGLITGERILESTDASGHTRFSVMSRGAPVFLYQVAATRYFVDSDALPFMGSELDPGLFDTASSAGAFAVTVQWHGAHAPAMPWLLDPRTVAPGVTDGTVTSGSGAILRGDLAQEPASARGAWTGPLAGIDHVSPASGATAPTRQSPLFVQYTLTVKGIDAAGGPDTGDALDILNTDNAAKFVTFASWNKGILKLSVPVGHYTLFGEFFSGTKSGAGLIQMVVVNTTVHANTTVTVDARTATSQISVSTPLPTSSGSGSVVWERADASGNGGLSSGVSWPIGGGLPPFHVFVTPTPAPKVGTQGFVVSYNLVSAPAAPQPYTYDLIFGAQGAIAARQHHTVRASQLAAVTTAYFSDVPNRASGESRLAMFPWQSLAFGSFDAFTAPEQRTEYVLAQPDIVWSQTVVEDFNDFAGFVVDSDQVFTNGAHTTTDWGRGPSGPGVQVDTGTALGVQACPACLQDNNLGLVIYPFGDNPPGHVGTPNDGAPGVTETDTTTLTRDGVIIASGTDPVGLIPVPPGVGHYTLEYEVAMSAPWWTLSTSTSTTWGFSTPRALAGPPPPGWLCLTGTTTGCKVVALMVADYEIPVSLLNTTPSGPVSFHLGIDHILGAAVAVTSATVSVSYNGGAGWHPANVSASGGGFTVAYTVPTSAHTVSLHIHATDADGGVLDQTIINAYGIS